MSTACARAVLGNSFGGAPFYVSMGHGMAGLVSAPLMIKIAFLVLLSVAFEGSGG